MRLLSASVWWHTAGSEGTKTRMCRLQQKSGMILKFAIGEVPPEHEVAIAEEEKACGSFLRIPVEEVWHACGCSRMQQRALFLDVHPMLCIDNNERCRTHTSA